LFTRNKQGDRPAHGDDKRWNDEHWRDHVLFYEYFHGDTGAGIGASHQTGWTGLIAFLIQGFTEVDAEQVMEKGMIAVTEASAEAAKDTAATEAVQIAEEVHKDVADKVVAQVIEAVQQQVTDAVVQGGQTEQIQGKVEQIVMEKIAEAVQKKADEVAPADACADEKKAVL
jgi:hypothetical protein